MQSLLIVFSGMVMPVAERIGTEYGRKAGFF